MCETKQSCCCGSLSFEVEPTEKGFKVNFEHKDEERQRSPKRIVLCCCEGPKDTAEGKCCT